MKTKYRKFMFSSKVNGRTAGLIMESERLRLMTVSAISRLFPYSEAMKMEKLHTSPEFDTWEEAFNYNFEEE